MQLNYLIQCNYVLTPNRTFRDDMSNKIHYQYLQAQYKMYQFYNNRSTKYSPYKNYYK